MSSLVGEFVENELGHEFHACTKNEGFEGEDFDVGYHSRMDERKPGRFSVHF